MSEVICKNQKMIDSQRICCFNNESVIIRYSFTAKSVLEVVFNFNYDNTDTRYNIESAEDGKIVINLFNFKSAFGSGLKSPQAIAKYNGKEISIVFFVTVLPEANPILDYSLYLEV